MSAGGTLTGGAGSTQGNAITYLSGSNVLDLGGTLNGNIGVLAGTVQINAVAGGSTLANVITGAGGLIQNSANTLTLTGVNTYTGLTTITSGTLALSGTGSIANSSGVADSGTFDISATTAGASIKTLSGNGGTTLGARTLTLTNASTTYGGVMSGTGGLTVSGGTEKLTGANTYTGTTTISGGTLDIGAGGTTGQIGQNGGTYSRVVTTGGTLVFDRSNAYTYGGVITGSGTVDQAGAGTTTLSGNNTTGNTFTGTANVNAGILSVGGIFGDTAGDTATVNVNTGGTLHGTGTIRGTVINNGGTISAGNSPGAITFAAHTVNSGTELFELSNPGTVGGAGNDLIHVTKALTINGGTLSLVNATDATAAVSDGIYRLYTYGTLPKGTSATDGFTTVSVTGATTYRLINPAGAIDIRVGAAPRIQFWDGSDATGATAGAQGGTGTFTSTSLNWVDSAGGTPPTAQNTTLRDSFQNKEGVFGTYTGATATVSVPGATPIDFERFDFTQTGYTLSGAGRLNMTGDTDLANDGANSYSAVTLAPPAGGATTALSTFYTDTNVTATVNTDITSAASVGLLKIGAGTLVLGGTNTYTGDTRVEQGTLQVNGGAAIPDTSRVIIGSTAAGAPVLDVNASETVGSLESVDPTVAAGTVQITAGQTLTFGGNDRSTQFGGTFVTTTGTAAKTGTGTFELTTASANSAANGQFLGTFDVTQGDVLVKGAFGNTGAGTVPTVNVNATGGNTALLAGGSASATDNLGKIYGNVNVGTAAGATGTLAPGMAIGAGNVATLKITGNLTLGAGSTSQFDLSSSAGTRGGTNDLVTVGGSLTVNGAAKLALAGAPVSGDYRLFDVGTAGTSNFTQANITTSPSAGAQAFTAETYRAPVQGGVTTGTQLNARVSVGGQLVQYWDGTDTTGVLPTGNAGPKGGNGNWNGTDTNWTQEGANTTSTPGSGASGTGGDVNDSWQGQVGVFNSPAGTVTVAGSQNFQGLQFESNYTLSGAGTINATGNPFGTGPSGTIRENRDLSFLNVDSGFTAMINADITGAPAGSTTAPNAPAAGIWKLGAGTLVLGGTDSYQGRTWVYQGTLDVSGTGRITASSQLQNDSIFQVETRTTPTGGSAFFGSADNHGTINVFGTLSTLNGLENEAGMVVNAGAVAPAPAAAVNGPITNDGTFNVVGVATTKATAVASPDNGTFTNRANATLNVGTNTGTGNYTVSGLVTNSGLIGVTAGSTFNAPAGLTNTKTGTVNNNGTITDALNNSGLVNNNAGATYNADVASNTGTINNFGTWNTLTVAGFNTSGILNTTGTLNANLGGLNNTGTVNAQGTINGPINNNAGFFNLTSNLIGNNAFNNKAGATLNVGANTYSGSTAVNNFGLINVAGGTITTGTFNNASRLSSANGTVGDVTQINGNYVASGNANLAIDVDLRNTAPKIADKLQVNGTVAGNTTVSFFSPQFAAPSSINPNVPTFVGGTLIPTTPVVVSNGGAGTFVPAQGQGNVFATNGGLVQYSLQQTAPGNYAIVSGANTAAITPIATSLSSAFGAISTSFFQSSSAFVVPASGKGPDQYTYGPWIRISGGAADIDSTGRDTQLGQSAASRVDTTFEGFQAGFDSGLINVDGTNTNFHIGVTTGIVGADASEKKAAKTDVSFSIPFVGVYGAVKHNDFSADVTYRHDFVDLRVNGPAVSQATNIPAEGDSVYGNLLYGIAAGKFSIIPSLGMGYSHYDIGNLPTVLGGNIAFRDFDSLLGRLGVQVGRTIAVTDKFAVQPFITGAVWHEFEGDTLARFTDPSGLFDQVLTTRVGTFGQVGVGMSAQLVPVGFTGFIRGDFRFGDKLNGQVGTMGIRYSF